MLNTTNKLQLQYYIYIYHYAKMTTALIIYIISHIHNIVNMNHIYTDLITYLYAILLRVVVDTHNVPSMQNAQHLAHATRAT